MIRLAGNKCSQAERPQAVVIERRCQQVAKKLKLDAQEAATLPNAAADSTAGELACLASGAEAFQVPQPCTQGNASPGVISQASGGFALPAMAASAQIPE